MLPDDPRGDIVARIRDLADVVYASLPGTACNGGPQPFDAITGQSLARVAGQARAVAALLEAGCELDARSVMRSALEHVTLLAWFSIDIDELAPEQREMREWQAKHPDENALWWVAHQIRVDQRRGESQRHLLEEVLTYKLRAELRAITPRIEEQASRGAPPSMEWMAAEVDAAWGGRLPGWPEAAPTRPAYITTIRELYSTLYDAGGESTESALASLLGAVVEPLDRKPHVERSAGDSVMADVDPFGAIATYLLLYAAAIAAHTYGGTVFDDALRVVGRFDAVRAPALLLDEVASVLNGSDGRRFAVTRGLPISVERAGAATTVVLAHPAGWLRVRHRPGPIWIFDGEQRDPTRAGPSEIEPAIAAGIRTLREHLHAAEWSQRAKTWPPGVP
jgi:hypothetical protein